MSDGQKSYEVRRVSIVPVSVIELTVFLSHPYADFYFKTCNTNWTSRLQHSNSIDV